MTPSINSRASELATMKPASDERWPRVAVIVVNWNGWHHTIECLESFFRIDYPDYEVIVCDNGSRDGSLDRLKAWAEGRLDIIVPLAAELRALSFPPCPKPIAYRHYDLDGQARLPDPAQAAHRLTMVNCRKNLGFAGATNVALRCLMSHGGFEYFWLLNNDTVVRPDALRHLIARMRGRPDAGICGSTLLCYNAPQTVQALGGAKYNWWLGVPVHLGEGASASAPVVTCRVEAQMSYVLGASLLVSAAFVQEIGFLSEDYFLYFEELDWATRARGRFALAYALESIVYHKEGAAIGSSSDSRRRSALSDFFHIRGRLRFTRKFYPAALPTVCLGVLASAGLRLLEGRWRRAWFIIRVLLGRVQYLPDNQALADGIAEEQRL
jgi:GT2 family glycosyltransferase